MSDLELVQFVQNLLFNAFKFFILQGFIDIVVVFDVIGDAHGMAPPTSTATRSAVPLVSPLVQHAVVKLGLQDVDV